MKQLAALALFLLGTGLSAQIQPIVIVRDADNNVVNGSTVIVYGNPGSAELELDLTSELNRPSSTNINVKRHELNTVAGSKNYFCWGVCYLPRNSGQTPTWVSVDPLVLVPNDTVSNFHAYYRPMGTTASCCFQYVWYSVSDPNDSTWVNICFDTETFTAIDEVAEVEPSINVLPNPVAMGSDLWLDYQLAGTGQAQVVVYNALGARALVRPLNTVNGRATVPTSTLSPGVWFAAVEQNGRTVATRRFVVTR